MKRSGKPHRGRGEGTIYRMSNGKWRAMLSLPNGKRISAVFDSKTAGQNWLIEQKFALLSQSKLSKPEGAIEPDDETHQTLGDYLSTWFGVHQSGLKATTRSDYQRIIEKHICPAIGELTLSTLRRSVFDQFYARLIEQGMGRTYVIYIHRVLRKALEDAVDDRLLAYNPAEKAKLPRVERRKHRRSPLTLEETRRLVETAMQTPIGSLVYTAVKTGMRQGELFALQWDDVDWQQRQIHVRRNVQRVKENGRPTLVFSSPKSESGNRLISVGEGTMQTLQRQMEVVSMQRAAAGDRWQEFQLVFPSTVGTPRNPSNFLKAYRAVLKAANVPQITFHDLRHMAASIMLNNGVPALVVSYILGHAQPSTTINMYGHEFSVQEIQAAEMMDQVIPQPEQVYSIGAILANAMIEIEAE